MEMSVSSEMTFFTTKQQSEICPHLRTGSSAEDRGRIDTSCPVGPKNRPVSTSTYQRNDTVLDRSQNISLHFICITFHLHYITFAFKNRATSA